MAKKFENILIASDLDGTFFGSKTHLVERNLEKIKYFCAFSTFAKVPSKYPANEKLFFEVY